MKAKLIQILLGAIGSAITVLISYASSAPPEVAMAAAIGAGPALTVSVGDVFANLLG